MIQPELWSPEQLDEDRRESIERFRKERLREPVELYTAAVDEHQGVIEEFMEMTVDLHELGDEAILSILTDER